MVTGINHITLAVSDLKRSLSFYTEVLGCVLAHEWESGAYLQAGDLWLCLSLHHDAAVESRSDYTHIAFSASPAEIERIREKIASENRHEWQANTSEGESLYLLDPDNHKLEIHSGTLATRLQSIRENGRERASSAGCCGV